MKVYLSADIEGVTGVTHWNETEEGKTGWPEACEQMTREQMLPELPSAFTIEIRYTTQRAAYQNSFYPGAGLTDPHTIRWQGDDYFEVLRLLNFVT